MLQIRDSVNIKYEVNCFFYRYFAKEKYYNESLKDIELRKVMDNFYNSCKPVFNQIEKDYHRAVAMVQMSKEFNLLFGKPVFSNVYLKGIEENEKLKEKFFEEIKEVYELIETEEFKGDTFFQMIDGMTLEDTQKLDLIRMYEDSEEIYRQYVMAMELLKPFVVKFIDTHQSFIDVFVEKWKQSKELDITKFLRLSLNENDFILYPSIMGINQATIVDNEIFMGIYFTPELVNYYPMDEKSALEITKMLSDTTKASFLHLLKKKSMYGKELAHEVGLSGATVSYHIQELVSSGCVGMQQSEGSNRIYYYLNKEEIQKALDFLKEKYL